MQRSAAHRAISFTTCNLFSWCILIRSRRSCCQHSAQSKATDVFVDSVLHLNYVPATHISMLPAQTQSTDRLESLRDCALLSDLQAHVDVSESEISKLAAATSVLSAGSIQLNTSLVLSAWRRKGHQNTSTVSVIFSVLAQHWSSSPFANFYKEIFRMLVDNENMLLNAFPNIITYKQRRFNQEERIRCQIENIPLEDGSFSTENKKSFLGQDSFMVILRTHLHAMHIADKLIVDSDQYNLFQEAEAAAITATCTVTATVSAPSGAGERTDNPFDTGTFTTYILPKLHKIPCVRFRRSVQEQGVLQSLSKITELMRVEKYEPVENHNVKIIGYIHAGGTVAYEKLCAAIEGLKYEASYTEMIVLVPADRQPRDD